MPRSNLQYYREKIGYSQADLSKELKEKHNFSLPQSSISRIEAGIYTPKLPQLLAIQSLLKRHGVDVTLDDLIEIDDSLVPAHRLVLI